MRIIILFISLSFIGIEYSYAQSDSKKKDKKEQKDKNNAKNKSNEKAKKGELVEKSSLEKIPEKSGNTRTFNVFVEGEYFEVGIDEVGGSPVITYAAPAAAPAETAEA